MSSLAGKKILLGITGSISAYKAATLIRLLVKLEAEVQVIMTTSASSFITPLTLATLSKKPALSTYTGENGTWNNHVELGLWADVMLIAPASANSLAKAAHGICDNLLMATYLSARCPVVWAPAMDLDMFQHPATQKNLETLLSFGNYIIEPEDGELASGLSGKGRLAEPENIVKWLEDFLKPKYLPLLGKKVLITAGPTQEAIDPVRFISNHSTGKMGVAIANYAQSLGADVTLIAGPLQIAIPEGIKNVSVLSALQMFDAVQKYYEEQDYFVMTAAVADYSVKNASEHKIKRTSDNLSLELVPNPDIAAWLGEHKKTEQTLVGFALETQNAIEYGKQKLVKKNLDYVVINSHSNTGSGFGHETNEVTIVSKTGTSYHVPLALKTKVAQAIWDFIIPNS
jgi:phosphopantothenoylcysteine decarboxylase/phosphopantothenate--cysteine ligase